MPTWNPDDFEAGARKILSPLTAAAEDMERALDLAKRMRHEDCPHDHAKPGGPKNLCAYCVRDEIASALCAERERAIEECAKKVMEYANFTGKPLDICRVAALGVRALSQKGG